MCQLIARFFRAGSGATVIEYGIIGALMSIAVAAAFPSVTSAVSAALTDVGAKMAIK